MIDTSHKNSTALYRSTKEQDKLTKSYCVPQSKLNKSLQPHKNSAYNDMYKYDDDNDCYRMQKSLMWVTKQQEIKERVRQRLRQIKKNISSNLTKNERAVSKRRASKDGLETISRRPRSAMQPENQKQYDSVRSLPRSPGNDVMVQVTQQAPDHTQQEAVWDVTVPQGSITPGPDVPKMQTSIPSITSSQDLYSDKVKNDAVPISDLKGQLENVLCEEERNRAMYPELTPLHLPSDHSPSDRYCYQNKDSNMSSDYEEIGADAKNDTENIAHGVKNQSGLIEQVSPERQQTIGLSGIQASQQHFFDIRSEARALASQSMSIKSAGRSKSEILLSKLSQTRQLLRQQKKELSAAQKLEQEEIYNTILQVKRRPGDPAPPATSVTELYDAQFARRLQILQRKETIDDLKVKMKYGDVVNFGAEGRLCDVSEAVAGVNDAIMGMAQNKSECTIPTNPLPTEQQDGDGQCVTAREEQSLENELGEIYDARLNAERDLRIDDKIQDIVDQERERIKKHATVKVTPGVLKVLEKVDLADMQYHSTR